MSGYKYKGKDLTDIVNGTGSDSNQGFNGFPGTKYANTTSTIESLYINNFQLNNINLLNNRISKSTTFTNITSVPSSIPAGVNYIGFIYIGSQGGGAGGQSCDQFTGVSFSGGGGGGGGPPYILCSNQIPVSLIGSNFNVKMGAGGGANVGIGPLGNAQSPQQSSAGAVSNVTLGGYNIAINGSTGGWGRGFGSGINNPANGVTGTYSTNLPTNYLITTSNNILAMTDPNQGNNVSIANRGGNGGRINNVASISQTIGLNSFNYTTAGVGGSGGSSNNSFLVNATAGAAGYFRIYYYYN